MRWAALAVYAVVVGSYFTTLYDPLDSGEDDGWAIDLALAAVHVGVGAALRSPRAMLLSVPVAVAGILTSDSALEGVGAVVGSVLGAGLIAAGWGLAELAGRSRFGAAAVAVGGLAPALVVWTVAAAQTAERSDSPHASPSLEARLPNPYDNLSDVCGKVEPEYAARLRRKAAVLIRELRDRPDLLVTVTYTYSEVPSETREITVRELAEEKLADMDEHGGPCPEVERPLREGVSQ
jgi:hypothetical protein